MSSFAENGQVRDGFDFDLGISGFRFSDLFDTARLSDLSHAFYAEIADKEPVLHDALRKYIDARGVGFEKRVASKILTDAAPFLSEFVARLFGIGKERAEVEREILRQNPIWRYKFFVQRRAAKAFTPEKLSALDHDRISDAVSQLRKHGFDETLVWDDELGISEMTCKL